MGAQTTQQRWYHRSWRVARLSSLLIWCLLLVSLGSMASYYDADTDSPTGVQVSALAYVASVRRIQKAPEIERLCPLLACAVSDQHHYSQRPPGLRSPLTTNLSPPATRAPPYL